MAAPLIIISGPSGVGKTTTTQHLIARMPFLSRMATVTTRQPRPGERNQHDYFFVSQTSFFELEKTHAFLETNKFGDHWYATPRSLLTKLEKGQPHILLPDINGAQKIIDFAADALTIWLEVPIEILAQRLHARASETPDQQSIRILRAKEEIALAHASSIYTHFIDMSDFEKAEKELEELIYAAVY